MRTVTLINRAWRFTLNDKSHRMNGPAYIQLSFDENSTKIVIEIWCKHGKEHRIGGPARISMLSHNTHWFKNGKLHREDGPAIEYGYGSKEYWINGKQITKSQFRKWKLSK